MKTIKTKTIKTKTTNRNDSVLQEKASSQTLGSLTVSIAEAKRDFSELCARARYARDTIVVTKHGRAVAAIVSVADLERAASLEDRYAAELLERAIATSPGTRKVRLRP